jgi:hypothetical protein
VVGLIFGLSVPAAALAASLGVEALMVGAITVRRNANQGWRGGVTADGVVFLIAIAAAALNATAT